MEMTTPIDNYNERSKFAREIICSINLGEICAQYEVLNPVKGGMKPATKQPEIVVFYHGNKKVGTLDFMLDQPEVKFLDPVFEPYAVEIHNAYQHRMGYRGCC